MIELKSSLANCFESGLENSALSFNVKHFKILKTAPFLRKVGTCKAYLRNY